MDQTIPRPESYRWANTDPITGKLIDQTALASSRLLQSSIRRRPATSSGAKAATAVSARRSSLVSQGAGSNAEWNPEGNSNSAQKSKKNPLPSLLPHGLRVDRESKFSPPEESDRSFFKNVAPTHPATPRSATAIRMPRPPTATTIAMLNNKKKGYGCFGSRMTSAGSTRREGSTSRESPILSEVNSGEDLRPATAGTGGASLRATYCGKSISGFASAPSVMLVIPHTTSKAKTDVLEKRIVECRQSPRRMELMQRTKDQEEVDAEYDIELLKKKDKKNTVVSATPVGDRNGSATARSGAGTTAGDGSALRPTASSARSTRSAPRSAKSNQSRSVAGGSIGFNASGKDVAPSSLQFYRYGKPQSILDETPAMPLSILEDMAGSFLCESRPIAGRAAIRKETFDELDRFDQVIAKRGAGMSGDGGDRPPFVYEESFVAPPGEVDALCGSPSGIIPERHGSPLLPTTTTSTTTVAPAAGSGSPSKSATGSPTAKGNSDVLGDDGSHSPGHNTEVVNKDYQLIRMMFQIELMDNTKANKALRAIGEEMIVKRLRLVKQRFGAKRLDKGEFFYAMELLIGVGTLSRGDSDVFFDMFDTNQSGGIDESEFLAGIRLTLHDQSRNLASYCKHMMDVRQALGTVITMMEIELMLLAVVKVAKKQYPGIQEDCEAVVAELQPQSHHSQVPIVFFRTAVDDTRVLSRVLKEISVDATLPRIPSPPPSPSPSDAFGSILADAEANEETKRKEGGGRKKRVSITASEPPASPPEGGDKKSEGVLAANTGKERPVIDVKNRRFRADQYMRSGQEEEQHPDEHHNPHWYLQNGVVWKTSELTGPMTMT